MADLTLSDRDCERAISHLVTAADALASAKHARAIDGFESLTGIGADVEQYLRGLRVARAALADAARTAGQSIRSLMREATDLDSAAAASLDSGFLVRGGAL